MFFFLGLTSPNTDESVLPFMIPVCLVDGRTKRRHCVIPHVIMILVDSL